MAILSHGMSAESQCVLVVDDDVDMREVLTALLDGAGYRVETARDGVDALKILGRGLRPAVIVLDMMMPRLDGAGFRAAQLADPRWSGIPVVAMSAFGVPRLEGVRESLGKPFDLEELQAAIARALAT